MLNAGDPSVRRLRRDFSLLGKRRCRDHRRRRGACGTDVGPSRAGPGAATSTPEQLCLNEYRSRRGRGPGCAKPPGSGGSVLLTRSDVRTPGLGALMQQLHLVGFTTDHKGLILGARQDTTSGSFVVMIDEPFIDQIEELLRLRIEKNVCRGGKGDTGVPVLARPKPQSRLSPREVQALLRSGKTIIEVAETAGVAEDWVARFAPPVMAEQAQVIARAGRMMYNKPRLGPSTQPLAESVAWNLADRGVELPGDGFMEAWSAFQQGAGVWVVRVTYPARGRDHHADWVVNLSAGTLTAVSRRSSELGYVEPGRRRPPGLPPINVTAASAARAVTAERPARTPPVTPPTPALRPSGSPSFARTTSSPTARGALDPRQPARRPTPQPVRPEPAGASGAVQTADPAAPTRGERPRASSPTSAPAASPPSPAASERAPARASSDQAKGSDSRGDWPSPAAPLPSSPPPARSARPASTRPARRPVSRADRRAGADPTKARRVPAPGQAPDEPAVKIIRRTPPRPAADGQPDADRGRGGRLARQGGDRPTSRFSENALRTPRPPAGTTTSKPPAAPADGPLRRADRSAARPTGPTGLADRAARVNARRIAAGAAGPSEVPTGRPARPASAAAARADRRTATRPAPAPAPSRSGAAPTGDRSAAVRSQPPPAERATPRPGEPGRPDPARSAGAGGRDPVTTTSAAGQPGPSGRGGGSGGAASAAAVSPAPVNGKSDSPSRPTAVPSSLPVPIPRVRAVPPEQRQWVSRARPPAAGQDRPAPSAPAPLAPAGSEDRPAPSAPAPLAPAGSEDRPAPSAPAPSAPAPPRAGAGAAAGRPAGSAERKRRQRPLRSAARSQDDAFAPGGDAGRHEPDTAPVPVIPPKWDELVVDVGAPNEGVVIKTGQAVENDDQPDIAADEWRYPAPAKSDSWSGAATNGKKSRLRLRRRPSAGH